MINKQTNEQALHSSITLIILCGLLLVLVSLVWFDSGEKKTLIIWRNLDLVVSPDLWLLRWISTNTLTLHTGLPPAPNLEDRDKIFNQRYSLSLTFLTG